MSSFIVVELDTTAPILEIYAPAYTTRETSVEVEIVSHETLDKSHEAYVIDEDGTRHDYNFSVDKNKLHGVIDFNGFPLGLAKLFIRVSDTVGNVSDLYEKVITIRESLTILNPVISDSVMSNVKINDVERKLETIEVDRKITINDGNGRIKE
ncbi:hypothetical protein [Bacillus phage vB_BanS-Thrax1]|nr:hypothetical protein [Bacillus phage vB_BanS-Thrax1]